MSNRLWKILSLDFSFNHSIFVLRTSLCNILVSKCDRSVAINEVVGSAREPDNPNIAISHYSTLSQLKVIDDKDNGISMVGIEQWDITHVISQKFVI